MTEFKIVKPECEDWVALYMNGKLIAEGHSLNEVDVLDAISDVFPNEFQYITIADEVAERGMPENFSEFKVNELNFEE